MMTKQEEKPQDQAGVEESLRTAKFCKIRLSESLFTAKKNYYVEIVQPDRSQGPILCREKNSDLIRFFSSPRKAADFLRGFNPQLIVFEITEKEQWIKIEVTKVTN